MLHEDNKRKNDMGIVNPSMVITHIRKMIYQRGGDCRTILFKKDCLPGGLTHYMLPESEEILKAWRGKYA